MTERNYTLLCDFYELTMGNGYILNGKSDQICYFDVFFRRVPDNGGYAIAAGLEQVIEYINDLHFDADDIEFLRKKGIFSEQFLSYLENFRFTGDIWAVPEGTPIFPHEPILTVRAKAPEAQLVETFILLSINHQSLIATKSSRIVRAAKGRPVSEFGSRRAQGADGAVLGARAAYIAGASGTACAISDKIYGVPAGGTMAHSWVQMFDSQFEAFDTYCKTYPQSAVLLVDTYNVLKEGVPDAIRAFDANFGKDRRDVSLGIRIDSGDIAYLSRRAREMLDAAGYPHCKIIASNSLDEFTIRDLINQGACIDAFGVGERLITSESEPVFGGVYKLAAIEDERGRIIPKIKISENTSKITNPHFKTVYRLFDRKTGKALADQICLFDEEIDDGKPLEIFDPNYTWKRKTLSDFKAVKLMKRIFRDGELVYDAPPLEKIREYCAEQMSTLWDEVTRFENPHDYYVDLSEKLWNIKKELLDNNGKQRKTER